MFIVALFLSLVFAILAGIHVYWFLGGTWAVSNVLPSKGSEADMVQIPRFMTLVVVFGLLLFSSFYLLKSGFIAFELPFWLEALAAWGIPSIFLLRAIGDFKYVGFFRKINDTTFAKWDAIFFSPFCLLLATLGHLLNFL